MFGRRKGDLNSRRFWSWFSGEAQGLANGAEALMRGESDAEWQLIELNERIRRFSEGMEADVSHTLDGLYLLSISGPAERVAMLLNAAPVVKGWRLAPRDMGADADKRRVPFRLAPRPSLDAVSPIEARYEAYAI